MARVFDVFISYSHHPKYSLLARAIQKDLHAFARPWYKPRAIRTYRDQTNIAATPDLWKTIEAALEVSGTLLVLASPEAAASPWVSRELEWWLKNRGPDTLMIAPVGGHFEIDGTDLRLISSGTTCLPAHIVERLTSLPLLIDLRELSDVPERQMMGDLVYREAITKLASQISGRPLDEIAGDDIRQQKIRKRIAGGVIVVVSIFALAAGISAVRAWQAQKESERQKQYAQIGRARVLGVEARRSADTDGDGTRALLLAEESMRQLGQASPDQSKAGSLDTDTDERDVMRAVYHAQSLPLQRLSFSSESAPMLPMQYYEPFSNRLYVRERGKIRVFDLVSWPYWQDLPFEPEFNAAVAVHAKKNRIAISDSSGSIIISGLDGKETQRRLHHAEANNLAFDASGAFLISASANDVKIWKVDSDERSRQVIVEGKVGNQSFRSVKKIAVSDQTTVLVVPRYGAAAVMDVVAAKVVVALLPPDGDRLILDGAISPDGRVAALLTLDGEVITYDLPSGRVRSRFPVNAGGGAIAIARDGRMAVGMTEAISIRAADTGREVARLSAQTRSPIDTLAFSQDGKGLFVAHRGGRFAYLAFPSRPQVRSIDKDLSASIDVLIPAGDNKTALAAGDGGAEVIVLDGGLRPARQSVNFSKLLAASRFQGGWRVIDAAGRASILTSAKGQDATDDCGLGGLDVAAAASADNAGWWTVAQSSGDIWICGGGKMRLSQIKGHPSAMAADASSRRVAILTEDRVIVMALNSPEVPPLVDRMLVDPRAVQFSDNGRWLGVGLGGGAVAVIDLASPQDMKLLAPHVRDVWGLMFDHAGDRIFTVSQDGSAASSQISTGEVRTFEGRHGEEAARLAIDESLGLLATGGEDGRVLIRHLASGALVQTYIVDKALPTALAFSGDTLLVGDDKGRIAVIPVGSYSIDALDRTSASLARVLTEEERKSFEISQANPVSKKEVACKAAIQRTDDPRSVLDGITIVAPGYPAQAELCKDAAREDRQRNACRLRDAARITSNFATALDLIYRREDASKQRNEAHELNEQAADAGCVAAINDLAEAEIPVPGSANRAVELYRKAAALGDPSAIASEMRLAARKASSAEELSKIRNELAQRSNDGDPWAAAALADTLMSEGDKKVIAEVFRQATRSALLFEMCETNAPERAKAVELRAAAFGLLADAVALKIFRDERFRTYDLTSIGADRPCKHSKS